MILKKDKAELILRAESKETITVIVYLSENWRNVALVEFTGVIKFMDKWPNLITISNSTNNVVYVDLEIVDSCKTRYQIEKEKLIIESRIIE